MKYSLLFLPLLIVTSYSAHPPIQEQPHKIPETMSIMVGLHCLDAIIDESPKNCPLEVRVFYTCCKASVCICTAYSLSDEIMDTCGINPQKEPLINNFLAVGFDFGLLHLANKIQATFRIKEKND